MVPRIATYVNYGSRRERIIVEIAGGACSVWTIIALSLEIVLARKIMAILY